MKRQYILSTLLTGVLALGSVYLPAQNNTPDLGATVTPTQSVYYKPVPYSVSAKRNFVRSWVPLKPITNANAINENASADDVSQSTTYRDAFGGELQSIQRFGVNSTRHAVSIADPRNMGDASLQYMGYSIDHATKGLKFQTNAFKDQANFYTQQYGTDGNYPYSMSKYVSTATDRYNQVLKPGANFVGSNRTAEQRVSLGGSGIRRWVYNATTGIPSTTGVYNADELVATTVTDEQGKTVVSYTDRFGRGICTKQTGAGVELTTYTVYDSYDRPVIVLTPKAVEKIQLAGWSVTSTVLNNLCVQTFYDAQGNTVEKSLPGELGRNRMVYDSRKRTVLVQTPGLALENKWQFSVYDNLDRVRFTGLLTSTRDRAYWQYLLDGSGAVPSGLPPSYDLTSENKIFRYLINGHDILNNNYPAPVQIPEAEILTYTYYDHYNYPQFNGLAYDANPIAALDGDAYTVAYGVTPQKTELTNGLATGGMVKVLQKGNPSYGDWITSVNYYDNDGRVLQTQSAYTTKTNNDGGLGTIQFTDMVSSWYDYGGRVMRNVSSHKASSGVNYVTVNKMEYEPKTFKLLKVWQSINDADWTLLSANNYDAITGQLKMKSIGDLEEQQYTYNLQGQLTGINGAYAESGGAQNKASFGESIRYDYGFSQPRYDGNIAGVVWKTASSKRRAYGYTYDFGGRMTEANFNELPDANAPNNNSAWAKNMTDYTVSGIGYDANGNITALKRRGMQQLAPADVDQLAYTYADGDLSNRLLKVEDITGCPLGCTLHDFHNWNAGSTDYNYDVNGNTTADLNKGAGTITYNFFNKPTRVTLDGGKYIEYVYTATGSKLEELYFDGSNKKSTQYLGGFVYENGDLQYINHAEGRVRYIRGGALPERFEYDFQVTDHLGNVRTTLTKRDLYVREYLATHEIAAYNTEHLVFDNLAYIRAHKPGSTNTQDAQAALLEGSDPQKRIGTAMLMHVMAGDKLEIAADAFYDGSQVAYQTVDPTTMLNSVVSALTGSIDPNSAEGAQAIGVVNNTFSQQNFLGMYQDIKNQNTNPELPRAYLNYLVYDESMNLVPHLSGVVQVNTPAWHILQVPELTIDQGGYISVFITNESMGIPVAFDNIWVKVTKGVLLEENHYYPFGQVIRGSLDETIQPVNKELYQGKELNTNATGKDNDILNWYDFSARQYDPQLGRFTSLDPMGQFASGYVGMGNNPVSGVDPSGMWVSEGAISRVPGTLTNQWGGSEGNYLEHRLTWYFNAEDKDKFSTWIAMRRSVGSFDTYAGDQTAVDFDGIFLKGHNASMVLTAANQINRTAQLISDFNDYKDFEKALKEKKASEALAKTLFASRTLANIERIKSKLGTGNILTAGGDGPGPVKEYGWMEQGSYSYALADAINQFNPLYHAYNFGSGILTSKDINGNHMGGGHIGSSALMTILPFLSVEGGVVNFAGAQMEANIWRVGSYNELRGTVIGLDAHHVGQKALMKQFISDYNPNTAPSILVPFLGHTRSLAPVGIVSRQTLGFTSARQVLARDIFELRRVYGPSGIPNSSLQELIRLNKAMYPKAF